jgi:hypothetical protein
MQQYQTDEHRRKGRNQVIGDVLWSYATNPIVPQYEGTLIDLSKFGLGMLTLRPVKDASIIRIYAKGLWKGAKYATVMWCEELETNIYRSGLLFNESP